MLWDGFRVPSRDSVESDRYNYKACHSRTAKKNCGNNDRLPKNLRIMRWGEMLLIHAEAVHGKTFVKGKGEVFPVPQTQIQLSGGLDTKPGVLRLRVSAP